MSPCQASRLPGIRLLPEHLFHQHLLLTASQTKWQDLGLMPTTTHARSRRHSKEPAALLCAPRPLLGAAGHSRALPGVCTGMGARHLPCSPVHLTPPLRRLSSLWFPQVVAVSQGRAGTHCPPPSSASALTSALFLLPPFPVLSRAVLAADLEGRQQRCHLWQEASPTPPVPALPLLGHWDPFACASARPSLLLARQEPRRFGSKGGTGQGSVTLEGSRNPHPTVGRQQHYPG